MSIIIIMYHRIFICSLTTRNYDVFIFKKTGQVYVYGHQLEPLFINIPIRFDHSALSSGKT